MVITLCGLNSWNRGTNISRIHEISGLRNSKPILFLDAVRGAKRVNTMDYVNLDMKLPLAFSRIRIEQLR